MWRRGGAVRAWRRGRCVRPGFESLSEPRHAARSNRAGGPSSRRTGPEVVFGKGFHAGTETPRARRARRGCETRAGSEAVRFSNRPAEPLRNSVNVRPCGNASRSRRQNRFHRRRLRPRRAGLGSGARCPRLGREARTRRARRANQRRSSARGAQGRQVGPPASSARRAPSSRAPQEVEPSKGCRGDEGSARDARARARALEPGAERNGAEPARCLGDVLKLEARLFARLNRRDPSGPLMIRAEEFDRNLRTD